MDICISYFLAASYLYLYTALCIFYFLPPAAVRRPRPRASLKFSPSLYGFRVTRGTWDPAKTTYDLVLENGLFESPLQLLRLRANIEAQARLDWTRETHAMRVDSLQPYVHTAAAAQHKWQVAAAQVRTGTRTTNRRARRARLPSGGDSAHPSRAVTVCSSTHQRQLHVPAPLTTGKLTTPPKPRTREWPFRAAPAAPVVASKSIVTLMVAEQSVPHSRWRLHTDNHVLLGDALESPARSKKHAHEVFPWRARLRASWRVRRDPDKWMREEEIFAGRSRRGADRRAASEIGWQPS